MKMPATEDLLLFGSLALTAIGVCLVVENLSHQISLAVGSAFIVFGLPSFFVIFLAAAEESK